ncbi:MAG: cytochrome P450 [Hyphomicrobiales bacterium]
MSYSLSAPLRLDLDGAANKADPFPLFASMRDAGPVIPVKMPFVGKGWLTTTHEACSAMVKDNALFVQEARHAGKSGVAGLKWWMPVSLRLLTDNMLLKDEPDHRRLRKLVDQAFQRRRVRDMRGEVEKIADALLDEFEGQDEVDLANAYSRRLPLDVICLLLGLPHQDRAMFSKWAKSATSMRNSFGIFRAFLSMSGVINYVREQIEECRLHPREGLISELVRAEEDGDKLSENELVSMVFLLLFAGFETTTHLISDSIIALEQNPVEKAYLLADPANRMERAVEELARYNSPVQSTKPRYASKDCEFFGQRLKRGDIVMALLASANYDPAVFDQPDRLKLDRFPDPHLVFGSGIHFCLGMQLARVEAQAAIGRLYARYPNLALAAPDNIEWIERFGLRGVRTLPVRLNAMQARRAA